MISKDAATPPGFLREYRWCSPVPAPAGVPGDPGQPHLAGGNLFVQKRHESIIHKPPGRLRSVLRAEDAAGHGAKGIEVAGTGFRIEHRPRFIVRACGNSSNSSSAALFSPSLFSGRIPVAGSPGTQVCAGVRPNFLPAGECAPHAGDRSSPMRPFPGAAGPHPAD